jgi:biotin carboxylase
MLHAVYAERPDGITCYWDPDLFRQSWLATALGLPTTPIRTVARLNDKLLQRQAHRDAGVPVPRFSEVHDPVDEDELERLAAEVGFPALLKPRDGTACQGIRLVEDAAQLAEVLTGMDHPGQMIFEERMQDVSATGPYADRLSIETIACDGAFGHLGITGLFRMMPLFRSTGGFFPADVAPAVQRELFEFTTTAIRALGSDFGFYRTEIKLTPEGPKIIEINGRPTGLTPTVVKLASGVPLLQLAMRLALGEHVVVDGPVSCDRIAYRYYHEPPMSATKVLGITGLSALGDLPGVLQVDVHKEVGDSLDWRKGSLDKIFQVTGTVASYEELAQHHELLVRDSYISYEHDLSQLADLPEQVPT